MGVSIDGIARRGAAASKGQRRPQLAEESIEDGTGWADAAVEAGAVAQGLVASRNMSLEKWARLVLQRHGGCFATHYIFAFVQPDVREVWDPAKGKELRAVSV